MRYPSEWYQMEEQLGEYFPELRPAQRRGLTLWVYGTILARSACQTAVLAALTPLGCWHALRQQLREWLYDGADRAAPSRTDLDVTVCFAPLLRWVVSWWQGQHLALALDATLLHDQLTALVISVLYRGGAIPVAWVILPANQPGAWMPPILTLVRTLQPAVPAGWTVLLLADRGLWSPRLWEALRELGWHPLLRVQQTIRFQPDGADWQRVRQVVPGPGHAWVGVGTVFKDRARRKRGTLLVVWDEGQKEPWVVLTDLPPERVGGCWYGLRVWIELGFRALKSMGWQWQRTRRRDPTRAARHWLVMAVATLWTVAYGTRVEDADAVGVPPARLQRPPASAAPAHPARAVTVLTLGRQWLQRALGRGRLWRRLWLRPEAWPEAPPSLHITYHAAPGPL
jgi:hypothetical protein